MSVLRPGRRRGLAALAVTVLTAGLMGLVAGSAAADSFTPVRLTVRIAPTARRGAPLRVSVAVNADPGVLDTRAGAMRIGVKLAGECGGDFGSTPGDTLLDMALTPQPATGRAYSATASGSGRPRAYGVQTVCVYLQDSGAQRVFANDESLTVDVSAACTAAAARYDADARRVAATRRSLRHARGARARRLRLRLASQRRTAAHDRSAAARVCGSGVPL